MQEGFHISHLVQNDKIAKKELFNSNKTAIFAPRKHGAIVFPPCHNPKKLKTMRTTDELQGVSLLGANRTQYPTDYAPEMLETFVNKHPENEYLVTFHCPEFTSLCPKTGQPDFATIIISYIPRERMVESKSLKLYLFSFRNHGDFHEDCINIILNDLVRLMDPKYIEVTGIFTPRGGISIYPFANYADADHQALKQQRLSSRFAEVINH